MADKQVVEVVHGKYDIVKETSLLGNPKFYIRKDGKPHRGSFASLRDAVEAARKEG